jgi:hypothetical protein
MFPIEYGGEQDTCAPHQIAAGLDVDGEAQRRYDGQ